MAIRGIAAIMSKVRTFALLLSLGMAGCTSTHHATPTSPDSSPSPAPTSSHDRGPYSDNALDACMWSDMANASHTANWQDSALTYHATDAALAELVQGLYSESRKGLVSKGAPVLHPRITSSTNTTADVKDCASSTGWLEYVAATGKLKNDAPGGNRVITARVELANGAWRVTRYTVGALGSC